MKRLLIFALSVVFILLKTNAKEIDEPIAVSGHFKRDYPSVSISREIKNILFLQERAQYPKAERGYWFTLDEQSAEVLGTKQIMVIPLNESKEENFWYNDANKKMVIYPMLGNTQLYYYTKDDSLITPEIMHSLQRRGEYLKSIKPNATIPSLQFTKDDYRFRPIFAEWLGSDETVIVKSKNIFDPEEILYTVTKLSVLAKKALVYSFQYDSYYNDFEPDDTQYITGDRYKKWIAQLPQPQFKKPDIKIKYKKTPWSRMRQITYQNESFLQREDNDFIYALTPEGDYIFDTKKDTLLTVEDGSLRMDSIAWKTQEKFRDATVDSWLESQGWLDSRGYMKLSNGNILLALVRSNGFEEQLYVHIVDKDTYKFSKALHLDSMVPPESSSASGLKIMKLFEAYGKYYLIINFGNSNYWAVLNDEMFERE